MFTMTDTETNIQFCERIVQNDDRPASRRNRKKKNKNNDDKRKQWINSNSKPKYIRNKLQKYLSLTVVAVGLL